MKRTLLFICTLLCANVLLAQTQFTVGDLTYETTSGNEVEVHGCIYSATSVVIPETVTYQETTYNVTSIGDSAFYSKNSLTSVNIPNSVTSIGEQAFYDCSSLTSANIPNSVTSIGKNAFCLCSSLTSITIPNSVTSIEEGTFQVCSNLTSVEIPNSVTYIGHYAFNSCSSLTSIEIPNSVTSIKYGAFRKCTSLTSIEIPNSVTSIEGGTFYDCSSLTSVTIPNSVTSIGYEGNGYGAFERCSSLTSVTIPNSVTYIGNYTFWDCSSLTSVNIPNIVTSIKDRTFYNCSSLTSMTIDKSNITGNTYYESPFNIPSLQNLTLGENVTSIGSGAFNNCSFLQNVTCLATTPPTFEDNTAFPYTYIATLTVPCGSLEAYSSATSFWNMFFAGRISENGYNVVATANDNAFGSVAVESDCSTGTLTATANEGYVFLSWNDGNTENPRVVSLTSDTSFVANFALIDESSLLEAEAESISFFPNPTKSEITFSQAIEKVEVIDLTGKTIFTFANAKTINIESLPAGAYYLRLTNNDKAIMQKVIKE